MADEEPEAETEPADDAEGAEDAEADIESGEADTEQSSEIEVRSAPAAHQPCWPRVPLFCAHLPLARVGVLLSANGHSTDADALPARPRSPTGNVADPPDRRGLLDPDSCDPGIRASPGGRGRHAGPSAADRADRPAVRGQD